MMHALNSYTRFELLRLLALPANRVLICIAAMAVLLATFMIGQWFELNHAGLEAFMPYALGGTALMAPALAMWLWAAERQRGTMEMLAAWPLSCAQVVGGKFLAGWLVMALFILLTTPLGFTALLLGDADIGLMLTQYFALWLLSGVFLAVAFVATVRASSLLVGFFAGIALVVAVLAGSWLIGAGYLPDFLPGFVRKLLLENQMLAVFARMGQGMVLVADFINLLASIGLLLLLVYVRRKNDMGPQPRLRLAGISAAVLLIVALLGGRMVYGIDTTAEKLHTPDAGVVRILNDIAPIHVSYTLYLSSDHPGIGNRQRLFIDQMQFYLQGLARNIDNVTFEVKNPTTSLDAEMEARRLYLEPTEDARGRRYYFALSIDVGGRRDKLYPSEARYAQLPRDLMEKTTALLNEKARRVLVLSNLLVRHEHVQPRFMSLLSNMYRVDVPVRASTGYISNQNDAVIVFRGTQLPMETIYALDQYVRRGGNVLVLEDPYLETAPALPYATPGPDDGALPYQSLHDLLIAWGMHFVPREVVYDPASAAVIRLADQMSAVPYPLWLDLDSSRMGKSPVVAGLSSIVLPEAGHFKLDTRPNLTHTPLLSSSEQSRWVERRDIVNLNPLAVLEQTKGELQVRHPAVAAEGLATGLFRDRPESVDAWLKENARLVPDEDTSHVERSVKPARIIAVADMDFLHERVAYDFVEGQNLWTPSNDNVFFFINAVRWLVGDAVVSDVRTSLGVSRPMSRLMPWVDVWQIQENAQIRNHTLNLQRLELAIQDRMARAMVEQQGSAALHQDLQQLELYKVKLMRALDEANIYTMTRLQWVARAIIALNMLGVVALLGGLMFAFRRRQA